MLVGIFRITRSRRGGGVVSLSAQLRSGRACDDDGVMMYGGKILRCRRVRACARSGEMVSLVCVSPPVIKGGKGGHATSTCGGSELWARPPSGCYPGSRRHVSRASGAAPSPHVPPHRAGSGCRLRCG